MSTTTLSGGCNCGQVRIEVRGEPIRVGVCHCFTCRKETGGSFVVFGAWDRARVSIVGQTTSWIATQDYRHFCPVCGSSLFATRDTDDAFEIRLGVLDDVPSGMRPAYELWTVRREDWLPPLAGAKQYVGARTL